METSSWPTLIDPIDCPADPFTTHLNVYGRGVNIMNPFITNNVLQKVWP